MAQGYLEKVLRHAEKKLLAEAQRKPTDLLDLYRHFLKMEEHRLKLAHQAGEGGREIVRRRAQLITVVLRDVWDRALQHVSRAHGAEGKTLEPEMLLAAVGGFGRGELNPYSDVDILFLYTKGRRTEYRVVENMVEQVLYMLWDVGFKVGHAARTLPELVDEANANLETKTSLLERRHLCGDEKLWDEFEGAFAKECLRAKGKQEEYLAWRVREQADRHAKFNGTVFVQEPNVKNGCGGLRDYQNLLWVAQVKLGLRSTLELQEKKLLEPGERKQIEAAYDFLLHLRTEMHMLRKRGDDILTLELQGKVANSLKYPQPNILRRTEALMRDYYQHARTLSLVCDTLAQRIAGVEKTKPRWAFLKRPLRIDGFVLKNGEIEVESPDLLSADPLRLVRAFYLAQQHNAEIAPPLALRIRRRLRYINRDFRYRKEVREMVLAIVRSKGKVGRTFRRMHELGVLGRLFPEFAPLTCLVQHEFFHRYTADEHTLVCLEMLDRIIDAEKDPFRHYQPLMQKIERPHLLYLAMLLHDTGKAENSAHHAAEGAVNAVAVARRLKLPAAELATLSFLVDHHTTMGETARRKNLDDPEAILEFARIVQTQERLDLLMLLTFADNEGTGASRQWSDWKELVLWQLYRRAEQALAGETEFKAAQRQSLDALREKVAGLVSDEVDPGEVEAHFATLPPRYFHAMAEPRIVEHIGLVHDFLCRQVLQGEAALKPCLKWRNVPQEGYSEVVVVSWDRERVFSKLAGAFAAAGFSILSADIFTRADNIVIDVFRFTTDRFEAILDERDQRKFTAVVEKALADSDFDIGTQIERKGLGAKGGFGLGPGSEPFPTRITFDQLSSTTSTLLDLQVPDRPGLLYDISECLNDFRLDIVHARITTEKGAALDTFYLTDENGNKLGDERILTSLAACIRGKIESDGAPAKP